MTAIAILMIAGMGLGCDGQDAIRDDSATNSSLRVGASSTKRQQAAPQRESKSSALLCEQIRDDEALTPSGASRLEHPGVEAANSERRCMALFGVDMPIGALRTFYRSTLGDLGYEVTSYREGDGIVQGNLSRTFLRASRPGRQVNVQIDEFDPAETTLARHRANVKLQIDAMRD